MRLRTVLLVLIITMDFFYGKSQTVYQAIPSVPSLIKGRGTVAFKLNGRLYKTDSTQTKCWTTSEVPLAMLWAKGNGLSVSWQIKNVQGKGTYRIDQDSKGSINFTISNKIYWIKKTDGTNYLTITITGIKDLYNVKILSGTFEGVIEDKDGNKMRVSEGRFTTEGI